MIHPNSNAYKNTLTRLAEGVEGAVGEREGEEDADIVCVQCVRYFYRISNIN